MATLYLDFENGDDNYAGTSFSLLASGTDGRISGSGTSRTFSSAGASFPDDGSLIGQYLSIYNGTIYAVYNITEWVSSTSLTIAAISGGTALTNQVVDRQYYIGGRWKSVKNGATSLRINPGDNIRVMGSPAPTSLGINGTWTSQELQPLKGISLATNAAPISCTCTSHGYITGDTVVISNGAGNTAINGTWEITVTDANTFTLDGSSGNGAYTTNSAVVRLRSNTRVMLDSAVTQNIASTGPGRAAWTQSTDVTTSLNTTLFKEHNQSDGINILTAFTTGKAAYYALPSTLDLSGYQQVSFWIRQETGPTPIPAGRLELRLCSDATGDTAVNTISIPDSVATGKWSAITVDLGSALGSSIASISLWVTSDISTTTNTQLYLSNIIACKASSEPDSLTLTSLIGKNTTGETWWGIQNINGTRVMLDADTSATPASTTARGYYGTSETVTTWKRETIKLGPNTSSTVVSTTNEAGLEGTLISYLGGWDRTSMTTQNLQTWLDGVNGFGQFQIAHSYNAWEKFAFVRLLNAPLATSSTGCRYDIIAVNNCSAASSNIGSFWVQTDARSIWIRLGHAVGNAVNALGLSGEYEMTLDHYIASNNSTGIYLYGDNYPKSVLKKGDGVGVIANNTAGVNALSGKFQDITFSQNGTDVNMGTGSPVREGIYMNCLFDSSTEVNVPITAFAALVQSHKHDQTADNHKIYLPGANISSATDQRKTASGISWKIQPTNTTRTSNWPIIFPLAKVACAANSLVTIKAWMRRDNTGLTMRLVCKGGQIAGVTDDVVSSMSAAADTWEEQTITFTPTEIGVVEITAEAYGGTTFSGWVDDLTISQA